MRGNGSEAKNDAVVPLHFSFTRPAEFDIAEILRALENGYGGRDAAIRFNDALTVAIDEECLAVASQIAERGRPTRRPHDAASVYFARPTYRLEVQTTKTRARRSGVGLWYVYYILRDIKGIGKPDTLLIYAVEHSTARPFAVSTGRLQDEGNDDDEMEEKPS